MIAICPWEKLTMVHWCMPLNQAGMTTHDSQQMQIFNSQVAQDKGKQSWCHHILKLTVPCVLESSSFLLVTNYTLRLNTHMDTIHTEFIQIKWMIQYSARNSILGTYAWIQLSASHHWLILGWSNLAQYQEWCLSVVPVSLFCDNKGQSKAVSRKKSYPIDVLLWRL